MSWAISLTNVGHSKIRSSNNPGWNSLPSFFLLAFELNDFFCASRPGGSHGLRSGVFKGFFLLIVVLQFTFRAKHNHWIYGSGFLETFLFQCMWKQVNTTILTTSRRNAYENDSTIIGETLQTTVTMRLIFRWKSKSILLHYSTEPVLPDIECLSSLFTRQNPSYVILENMVTNSTESTMDELTGES